MGRILLYLAVLLAIPLIVGCARFPSTGTTINAPKRTLYSSITVQGHINPNYYYFLALGVDQNSGTGPVPVLPGYGYTNGWGTITPLPVGTDPIQPPFFVRYSGSFEQVREGVSLSFPYRYGISSDGKTLWVEIDQSLLDPLIGSSTDPIIQLNWITMKYIDPTIQEGDRKEYDGFGPSGNDYLDAVPLRTEINWVSGQDGIPEEPVYGPDEATTADEDIDISEWRVEVHINNNTDSTTE